RVDAPRSRDAPERELGGSDGEGGGGSGLSPALLSRRRSARLPARARPERSVIRPSVRAFSFVTLLFAGTGAASAQTTLFVKNYVNSNEIQSITPWRGLVAMGTLGGVVTIDPSSGVITKILGSPGGLPSDHVLSVEVSPSGMLWAGTADRGVARIRPDGTFRRPLSSCDGLPSGRVQAVYTRGDTVWVATSGGVALFTENPGTGQIGLTRAFTNASTSGGLAGDDVRAFLQVADTLWVGTTAGLSSFAGGAWQNRTPALSLAATSLALHADTLWAATSLGPYRYAGGVFQPGNSGHAFPSQVLVESAQGFFSGSAALGVYQYAPGAWQSTGAGLPTPRVGALRDGPDGALWAGTSGGAARLRPGSSAWEPHLSDGPLVNGTQRAVVDPRGVWFTTGNDFPAGIARGVVLHFDGVSWSALTSATTGGAFEQADAFGILSDATGRIWIGHCCANAEPRPRIDRYDHGNGIWDQPPAYNILTFAQSPVSGQVLAGSSEHENGVYVFDAVSGALLDSLTPANSGIRSNNLRSVRFDSAGKGWFGTAFNGLDVWDGRGTTLHADDLWTHYVAQPDNQVTSIAVIDPAPCVGRGAGRALGGCRAGRLESGSGRNRSPGDHRPGLRLPESIAGGVARHRRNPEFPDGRGARRLGKSRPPLPLRSGPERDLGPARGERRARSCRGLPDRPPRQARVQDPTRGGGAVKLQSAVQVEAPPDRDAWNALVAGAPEATVFHTSAWAELWTREWRGARWVAFVLEDEAGYAGGIP